MSKQICNAAGGELEVTSEHMLGSVFKFSMLLSTVDHNQITSPPIEEDLISRKLK